MSDLDDVFMENSEDCELMEDWLCDTLRKNYGNEKVQKKNKDLLTKIVYWFQDYFFFEMPEIVQTVAEEDKSDETYNAMAVAHAVKYVRDNGCLPSDLEEYWNEDCLERANDYLRDGNA
jgi:hypothetical protein